MAGNPDYNTLATSALNNYTSMAMADAISTDLPFIGYLMEKKAVKLKGGKQIELPILYGSQSADPFSPMDSLTFAKREVSTAAIYDWKYYRAQVVVDKSELDQANGPAEKQDIMKTNILAAELSLKESLAAGLVGDGTGFGGLATLGLKALVPVTAGTTVGGIDSSVDTWWEVGHQNASAGSFSTGGIGYLGTALRSVKRGLVDKIDLILAGANAYQYMEDKAGTTAFMPNPELAGLGFTALKFHGVNVVYDPTIDSDYIYGINTKYMNLMFLDKNPSAVTNGKPISIKEKMFQSSAFADQTSLTGQLAMTALIHTTCQLVTNDRARHFVIAGVTA